MKKLIAVNFHYIRENYSAQNQGIFGITPKQFERQLVILDKMGNFASSQDICDLIYNNRPLDQNILVITFDDGLQEQFELALPILDKLGIPAIFFINTQQIIEKAIAPVHKIHQLLEAMPFEEYQQEILNYAQIFYGIGLDVVDTKQAHQHYYYDNPDRAVLKYFLNFYLDFEKQSHLINFIFQNIFPNGEQQIWEKLYMNREQILALNDRDYLGSHSHKHIPLGLYSADAISDDIIKSKEIIKSITGKNPLCISYPYGSYESTGLNVMGIARNNGFVFGFTMERAGNSNFNYPLGLARFDCNDVPGGKSFENSKNFINSVSDSIWFRV